MLEAFGAGKTWSKNCAPFLHGVKVRVGAMVRGIVRARPRVGGRVRARAQGKGCNCAPFLWARG